MLSKSDCRFKSCDLSAFETFKFFVVSGKLKQKDLKFVKNEKRKQWHGPVSLVTFLVV